MNELINGLDPEEKFPEERVRRDVPFWRFAELLSKAPLSYEDGIIIMNNHISPADLGSKKKLNRKLINLSELCQSKCN